MIFIGNDIEITQEKTLTSKTSTSKPYKTQIISIEVREMSEKLKLLLAIEIKNNIIPIIKMKPLAIFFKSIFILYYINPSCFLNGNFRLF